MDWIIKYELYLRTICFVGVLGIFAYWEAQASWRKGLLNRRDRWITHLLLGGISVCLVRLSFALLPLGIAVIAERQHLGLLNQQTIVHLPLWLTIGLSLLGMDFALYTQHRWLHRYQLFFRVHRVHHSDTEVDVTTGLRFHPIEYFFMMAIKLVAIVFLGAPVIAVFVFEIMVSSFTLFIHSNIQIPLKLDLYLKWIFVTPSMHRIHHSDIPFEHNRNFGFCFSIWDRLCNTYLPFAHQGQKNLVFGLEIYRSPVFQTFQSLLTLPFLKYKVAKNKIASLL